MLTICKIKQGKYYTNILQKKKKMVHIPTPVPRLCLTFEFDIDGTKVRPSNEQHDVAIKEAAKAVDNFIHFSQHGVTPDAFAAKVMDGTTIDPDRQLRFTSAHNAPFDPNFHVAYGGPAIRYEFIYSDIHPMDSQTTTSNKTSKLFLRIVTSFGKPEETIDGVLATRIGLTALEILEGNEVHPTIFPRHPPAPIGLRMISKFLYHNVMNGLLAIPYGYMMLYMYTLLDKMGVKKEDNMFRVNSVVSLLKFHDSPNSNESARYQLYRTETKGAFRTFLTIVEEWTQRLGLDGYFYLVNVSPFAAPAITYNIQDISNIERRNRNTFAPPGPPPGEDIWKTMNYTVASKMVINNYGAHKHNFSAKPISFLWDWLDVRNSAHLSACITINGVLLTCFRGLESSFDLLSVPEETFASPPTKAIANTTWRKTMQ